MVLATRMSHPSAEPDIATLEAVTAARERQVDLLGALGRMAGGIAHDFNNLLSAMTGYAEFLEHQLQSRGDCIAELRDLNEIRMAAARMHEQTRRLLAFAQRLPGRHGPVAPHLLVRGIERPLRQLAPAQTTLSVSLTSVPGFIDVDRAQIEQVLINLTVNGFDAMPDGGTLTIGAKWWDPATDGVPAGIVIGNGVPPVGTCMHFHVTDTGRGMSSDYVRQAFLPFETTKTTVGTGEGLGLAAVYGSVTKAHGLLIVESALHVGTTVHVLVPRAPMVTGAEPDSFPA